MALFSIVYFDFQEQVLGLELTILILVCLGNRVWKREKELRRQAGFANHCKHMLYERHKSDQSRMQRLRSQLKVRF